MPEQLRPIGIVSGASVLVKCDENGVREVPIAPSTNRNCLVCSRERMNFPWRKFRLNNERISCEKKTFI